VQVTTNNGTSWTALATNDDVVRTPVSDIDIDLFDPRRYWSRRTAAAFSPTTGAQTTSLPATEEGAVLAAALVRGKAFNG